MGFSRARTVLLCCVLAATVAPASAPAAPTEIQGGDGAFRATVPDGYAPAGAETGTERWFARPQPGGGEPVVLVVRVLRSTVGRDERSQHDALVALREQSGPGALVRQERGRAMDLDVPVLIARRADGSESVLATLPAMPRAVQVVATGDAASEAEMLRAVRAVMTSFRGASNWLTDAEVRRRGQGRALLAAAWAILLAYALAWALRFRRAPTAFHRLRSAWLMLSALAFAGAAALLASVPAGATALGPWPPALVGAVVALNAVASWRGPHPPG